MFVMMTLSPDTMPLSAEFYSGELFSSVQFLTIETLAIVKFFSGRRFWGMLSSRTLFKSKAKIDRNRCQSWEGSSYAHKIIDAFI